MKFSPQFLDELRSRTSLSHVVGGIVQLKKMGTALKGLCPFHKEKTPSFNVNDDKGFYHCFGCGAGGDVFDFIINTQGLSFPEAVEKVADECGMPLPKYYSSKDAEEAQKDYYPLLEEACLWFQEQLKTPSGRQAQDYIKSRKIAPEVSQTFRLGYAPSGKGLQSHLTTKGYTLEDMLTVGLLGKSEERGDVYPKFRNRLIFPILNRRGRVIAFGGRILGEGQPKYLNSPESPVFHKRRTLYNFNLALQGIKEKHPLIVCEGYMDVIALYQASYRGAVAPLGTAMGEEQIEELWRSYDEPILCFDGDTAGEQAAIRVAKRALPILVPGKSLKFVSLPAGEDPDTLIQSGQKSLLDSLIQKATPLSQTIWASLIQEVNPSTPERQALLFNSIGRLTHQIQDTSVRISYQQMLRDKYFANFRQGKSKPSQPVKTFSKNQPVVDTSSLQRRILLATVVNHPSILHEIFEEFSDFHLPIAEMDNLRHEIIQCLEENNALDKEHLRSHLRSQGYDESLKVLLEPGLYLHARFASPQASDAQALTGWKEVFSMMVSSHQTKSEISTAQKELSQEMDEDTWTRLKHLKQATLD